MDVKKWISEYPYLQAEAESLYIALEKLLPDGSASLESQNHELTAKLHEILDRRDSISKAIDSLKDPLDRCILRERYIHTSTARLTPWREIAKRIRGNDAEKDIRYISRRHKIALEHLHVIVMNGAHSVE